MVLLFPKELLSTPPRAPTTLGDIPADVLITRIIAATAPKRYGYDMNLIGAENNRDDSPAGDHLHLPAAPPAVVVPAAELMDG